MGCNDVLYLCATPESIHCSFGSSLETQLAHESSLSHQRPLLDNHPKVLSVFQSRFQSRRSPKPERSVPTSQAPKWAFIVEVGKLLAQLFSAHGSNRQLCHGHSRFFLGGIWTCIPQWESWNWVCIKKIMTILQVLTLWHPQFDWIISRQLCEDGLFNHV